MPTGDEGLTVRGLRARAGTFELAPVDLDVAGGRVLILLGPSGSGKTTLLDTIAGLRRSLAGTVRLAGQDLTSIPPQRRRIGMVFQHGALFPNLSVAENVRFGLRARRDAGTGHADVLVRRLGLERLADRSPRSLSGGEAQRVALARALAIRPGLLLLDEPLSALDLPAREELRGTLQDLLADLSVPVVYVTHDRDEALSIGDDIAVLVGGGLRRSGTAGEVASDPRDPVVARLLGWRELGRGTVSASTLRIGQLTLHMAGLPGHAGLAQVFYRPEAVLVGLGSPPPAAAGHFTARVVRIFPTVPLAHIDLAGPPAVTALLLHRQLAGLGLRPGAQADVAFPPEALHVIPVPGR
jgi:ABC-type Fe3+/spermidine/putrescine transport system ATPase subunit